MRITNTDKGRAKGCSYLSLLAMKIFGKTITIFMTNFKNLYPFCFCHSSSEKQLEFITIL